MAKQVRNFIGRAVVGVISIAVTATVSVMAQQYLVPLMRPPTTEVPPAPPDRAVIDSLPESVDSREKPAATPLSDTLLAPDGAVTPSSADKEGEQLEEEKTLTHPNEDEKGDRDNRIMKQFWEKLNR